MRPIEINLASTPYRNDLPLLALLIVLGAAGLGWSGWNAHAYVAAGRQQTELREQLADHHGRMNAARAESVRLQDELQRVDQELLGTQADFVAQRLAERNLSWTLLLNALEDVTPWNTRLTAVRPVFHKGRIDVVLDGASQDMEAFLGFQQALLDSSAFTRVVPGDYQRGEADQRITFTITAAYLPDAGPAVASAQPSPPAPEALAADGPDAVTAAPAPSEAPRAKARPTRAPSAASAVAPGGATAPSAAAAGAEIGASDVAPPPLREHPAAERRRLLRMKPRTPTDLPTVQPAPAEPGAADELPLALEREEAPPEDDR